MCGIAGFFNYKSGQAVQESHLAAILESLQYRGPDSQGMYCEGNIGLGSVRLAIQGLAATGNQPIYNEDNSVVVVYSGELYNYPALKTFLENRGHLFRSATDTEALVHLYEECGPGFADRLNGMFAFALFDTRSKTLLLGRDRSAQKPLYIEENRNGIFFSSEIKSMLPYLEDSRLNPSAVRAFLSMGYVLEPETILARVRTAEPGAVHLFDSSGEVTKRFWQVRCDSAAMIDNEMEWHGQADRIIGDAVKRHLLSDVPVTVLLSGGIDSSLLALYLADQRRITKAYTGSFVDSTSHDEYGYAEQLGQRCGFDVERVRLSNRLLADNLESFLSSSSMPQGDNSGIATYCMAREISREFKVVLGGDGGDELFGGYPTYTFPYLAQRYSFIPPAAIAALRRLASLVADKKRYLSWPFKLQQLLLAWGSDIPSAHFSLKNFLPDQLAGNILAESFFGEDAMANADAASRIKLLYEAAGPGCDAVKRLCITDFSGFLRSATIPKVERNCMAFSLEGRMPYLDNTVLDLSLRTSSSLMVEGSATKKCLKALLQKKFAGNAVMLNPIKQGFTPPIAALLEHELCPWKENWLNHKSAFFTSNLQAKLAGWSRSGWDLHRLEWHICILNDWCHRNKLL